MQRSGVAPALLIELENVHSRPRGRVLRGDGGATALRADADVTDVRQDEDNVPDVHAAVRRVPL